MPRRSPWRRFSRCLHRRIFGEATAVPDQPWLVALLSFLYVHEVVMVREDDPETVWVRVLIHGGQSCNVPDKLDTLEGIADSIIVVPLLSGWLSDWSGPVLPQAIVGTSVLLTAMTPFLPFARNPGLLMGVYVLHKYIVLHLYNLVQKLFIARTTVLFRRHPSPRTRALLRLTTLGSLLGAIITLAIVGILMLLPDHVLHYVVIVGGAGTGALVGGLASSYWHSVPLLERLHPRAAGFLRWPRAALPLHPDESRLWLTTPLPRSPRERPSRGPPSQLNLPAPAAPALSPRHADVLQSTPYSTSGSGSSSSSSSAGPPDARQRLLQPGSLELVESYGTMAPMHLDTAHSANSPLESSRRDSFAPFETDQPPALPRMQPAAAQSGSSSGEGPVILAAQPQSQAERSPSSSSLPVRCCGRNCGPRSECMGRLLLYIKVHQKFFTERLLLFPLCLVAGVALIREASRQLLIDAGSRYPLETEPTSGLCHGLSRRLLGESILINSITALADVVFLGSMTSLHPSKFFRWGAPALLALAGVGMGAFFLDQQYRVVAVLALTALEVPAVLLLRFVWAMLVTTPPAVFSGQSLASYGVVVGIGGTAASFLVEAWGGRAGFTVAMELVLLPLSLLSVAVSPSARRSWDSRLAPASLPRRPRGGRAVSATRMGRPPRRSRRQRSPRDQPGASVELNAPLPREARRGSSGFHALWPDERRPAVRPSWDGVAVPLGDSLDYLSSAGSEASSARSRNSWRNSFG